MTDSAKVTATNAILKESEQEMINLRCDQRSLTQLIAEQNECLNSIGFALNRMNEAAYLLDATGRFLYSNDEASQTLGYGSQELSRMRVWDIDPDWTAQRWEEAWAALREQGSAVIETVHRRKDGSLIPVQIKASYFEYGGREFNLAIARDVTERERTRLVLRESEQAFRSLAENAPDSIIRYDRNFRRTYVNPEFTRMSGVEADTLLGEPRNVMGVTDATAQEVQAKLKAIMESGVAAKFEVSWTRHGKPQCWYAHAVPEYGADGVVQSVLTIWRDITDRKEAEKRLLGSYQLLRELTSRRETALEEERKRIAREMHDELGQHLTALRMGVSTLRMRFAKFSPNLDEDLQKILRLSDGTMHVLRNLVTSLRPAALDAGLSAALEWLATDFSQRSHTTCDLCTSEEILEVPEARAIALFRIVQEALTNVSRHANARHVEIALKHVGNECHLRIRDDGRGFDPGGISKKSFGLVGISERVSMLGGSFEIVSSPGFGTSLQIRLPFG